MKPSLTKAGCPGFRNLVGKQIRECRQNHGWTQKKFGIILKDHGLTLSRSSLAKIEQGDRYVLDYELAAMATALEVSLNELIPPKPPKGFGALDY